MGVFHSLMDKFCITFGNNLEPTSDWKEVMFSMCLVLSGLLLFALLIGNIQVIQNHKLHLFINKIEHETHIEINKSFTLCLERYFCMLS